MPILLGTLQTFRKDAHPTIEYNLHMSLLPRHAIVLSFDSHLHISFCVSPYLDDSPSPLASQALTPHRRLAAPMRVVNGSESHYLDDIIETYRCQGKMYNNST